MGWFGRRRSVPEEELGAGTGLPVTWVDGQAVHLVEWTADRRRTVAAAHRALRVLRTAGVRGSADVRTSGVDAGADVEVTLRGGARLRLVVDVLGIAAYVVGERDRADDDVVGILETTRPEPLDQETALGDVAFAVSSLASHEAVALGLPAPGLPAPLAASRGSVQLLPPADGLPARWCVCVFVTREHEVPDGADERAREDLWIEHSVGVKLHLDGRVARDPEDEDPRGERSQEGLDTAAVWAGAPVDLLPYARWLADETQRRLDLEIPGLAHVG